MKKFGLIAGGIAVLLVGLVVAGIAVLKSMDFSQYKSLIAEQAKAATGRDLDISGEINLEISLTPALAVEGISFSNADWGSRKEMATLNKLEAQVALMPLFSGNVQVERLVLHGLDLLAETDAKGRGNWEFGEAKAEKSDGGALPVVKLVDLRDVKVAHRDGKTGETVTIVIDSLQMGAESADAPLSIQAGGRFNDLGFKAAGKLGSIAAMMAGKDVPLSLKLETMGVSANLEGRVADINAVKGVDLVIDFDIPSPKATIAQAKSIVPDLGDVATPELPIKFSGRVKDAGGGWAVEDMKFTAGANDLTGRLAVALGGARPAIEADLASNRLHVDELLPPGPAKEPAKKESDEKRVFSADPLPLDGLKAADAKVKFAGREVKSGDMVLADVAAQLDLSGGNLKVSSFGFGIHEGTVGGSISLDASRPTPPLAVDIKVRQVDYGAALTAMGQKDIAKGRVDADINLKGAGASVRAIMAGLDGKTRIVTEGGHIESGALNIASADVFSVMPFLKSEGDKDIRCGVVDFDITKGQAKARAIVFETGGISVIGTGGIDLGTEGLNLRVEPRAKKSSLVKLAEIPVNVGGLLAEPKVTPDVAETAKAVAGTVATVAGAVATGGVSLLAQSAVGKARSVIDPTDYCTPALAGQVVVPGKLKEAEEEKSDAPAESSSPTSGVTDAVKGLSKGVKGLFGDR